MGPDNNDCLHGPDGSRTCTDTGCRTRAPAGNTDPRGPGAPACLGSSPRGCPCGTAGAGTYSPAGTSASSGDATGTSAGSPAGTPACTGPCPCRNRSGSGNPAGSQQSTTAAVRPVKVENTGGPTGPPFFFILFLINITKRRERQRCGPSANFFKWPNISRLP